MSVFLHRMGILSRNLIPEFIPTSLSGCALWLDAADANTLYDATSGGSLVAPDGQVARWEDKSGNARHFNQNTSGFRPLRKTDVQNGLDTVRFGGDDRLQNTDIIATGNPAITIFTVVQWSDGPFDGNGAARIVHIGKGAGEQNLESLAVAVDDNRLSSWRFNGGFVQYGASSAGMHVGTWQRSASETIANSSLRIDGESLSSVNSGNGSASPNLPSSEVVNFVGAGAFHTGNIGNFVIGDIAEILIYNRALNSTERRQVEEYLQEKWATPALPEI